MVLGAQQNTHLAIVTSLLAILHVRLRAPVQSVWSEQFSVTRSVKIPRLINKDKVPYHLAFHNEATTTLDKGETDSTSNPEAACTRKQTNNSMCWGHDDFTHSRRRARSSPPL
eukprot:5506609-Pyramimonas_sp.AAC.1